MAINKIVLRKRKNIRQNGKQVRISEEVDRQLDVLVEQTGISKSYLVDLLISEAIEAVEIREE